MSTTKALPRRRPAPISGEQMERVRAGYQRAKIRVNREVIAAYVEKLPESRRGEILSGNFTREQIQNCVPDRVLQALDAEGNYRHRTGNLRDQASRAAILRQNILHQQKR